MKTTTEATEKFVSLATLNGGAAIEQFDNELDAVLQNILDVNTNAESKREVTLKVTIKPADSRKHGDVTIQVTSKLAPAQQSKTVFFFGSKKGHAVAAERDLNQLSFLDEEFDKPTLLTGGKTSG